VDTEVVEEVLAEVITAVAGTEEEDEVLGEGGVEGGVREKRCWGYTESGVRTGWSFEKIFSMILRIEIIKGIC
jgi:hypothetical protein